ncbi:oligosaccharide flippase family protein [uncultured Cetobacterium sp.]|uniref:lipopolysaccharide biosynthesis protein n=1 Tax=uncultured Cetobacterium sp. TaxID=527638 RepID=UPI0026212968|nr:oligosaccharide flippase family protein [uncultured Cetobacterium sp.]
MNSGILKNLLSFSIGNYISMIIGIVTTPIVTRLISPSEYGVVSLYNTFANIILIILLLGLDQGFIRFYSVKKEEENELLYSCLIFPLLLSIIILTTIYIFRYDISIFIFKKNDNTSIYLFMTYIIILLLNRFSYLIIRMKQKGKIYSTLQIIQSLCNFICIVLFYQKYNNNYKTLIISSLISTTITTFITIYFEKRVWKFPKKIKIEKYILLYSYPFIATMSITWIFQSLDKIVLKIFSTSYQLGLYAGADKIIVIISLIQTSFTTFWAPLVYKKYEDQDQDFFIKVNEYVSFIMLFIGIIMINFRMIFELILGKNYSEVIYIIPCLVLVPIILTISEITVVGINIRKKTKLHIVISVVVTVVNLIGNLILVKVCGAIGAAISTAIAYIIFYILRTEIGIRLLDIKFNVKKVYILLFLILIYSIYVSFKENNIFIIGLYIALFYSYKNILKECEEKFIKFIKKKS